MRAILFLAAVAFIIAGAAMAAAPFLWPVSVAFGISIGQGLGIMLGGFVLLALAAILSALAQQQQAISAQLKPAQSAVQQPPAEPPQAGALAEEEEAEPEPQVVAERVIAGQRARILSDGSIDAELEQGWLRFDDEQHLRDYLRELNRLREKGLV